VITNNATGKPKKNPAASWVFLVAGWRVMEGKRKRRRKLCRGRGRGMSVGSEDRACK